MVHAGKLCIKRQFNFLRVPIMIDLKKLIKGDANKQRGGGKENSLKLIDGGPSIRETRVSIYCLLTVLFGSKNGQPLKTCIEGQ